MSDRLTLSCWIRGFQPLSMLAHWERLLRMFPYSRLGDRFTTCRIYAVELSEPVLFENAYRPPFDPGEAMRMAHDYQHEDSAYQVEAYWDLIHKDADWALGPVPVSLWCFGPAFVNETGDHLRIEFGPEDVFLPIPGDDTSLRASQTNLRSLTRLVQEIGQVLPVDRLHLWSESGANFAEKLERAVAGGGSGLALQ